jgi:transmembrane 9 superfamily protein 2/4
MSSSLSDTAMAPLIRALLFSFLLLLLPSCPVTAFYLPGVAPRDFAPGDQLLVKVNKITSIKTQLPYEYYSLEFCKPDTIINSAENLGEVLRGDRIENSVYMVSFSFFFIIWPPYMLPRLSEHHRCLHKYP